MLLAVPLSAGSASAASAATLSTLLGCVAFLRLAGGAAFDDTSCCSDALLWLSMHPSSVCNRGAIQLCGGLWPFTVLHNVPMFRPADQRCPANNQSNLHRKTRQEITGKSGSDADSSAPSYGPTMQIHHMTRKVLQRPDVTAYQMTLLPGPDGQKAQGTRACPAGWAALLFWCQGNIF